MGFPGSVLLNQGDIYKETSDKRHPLGTRGYTRDGRVFRYSQCSGTAITSAGNLIQAAPPPDSGNWSYDLAVDAEVTTDSTSVLITATTACATANYFADGYLFVSDACGIGQMVQVKSHAAMTSGATAQTIKLRDEDKFHQALTTASKVGLIENPYQNVIIKPATLITAPLIGVNPIPVTANYYFWLQTWGPAPVLQTAAFDINLPVVGDSATAGAAQKLSSDAEVQDQFVVGQVLSVASGSGDCGLVVINFAP